MPRRLLPIGIQSFREIRERNAYYVDKTGFAQRLIEQGKYYFLSRPRRFGKSLFVDTLDALFSGQEDLFQGLFIHDKWDWQRCHPVIRISFGDGVLASRAELDEKIREILTDNENRLGVKSPHKSISGRFHGLIHEAHLRFGEQAVVLVDEYDKPILDNLTHPQQATEIRDGLRNLYSVIKSADADIRFALLTGVSKFSKVSLFSGLNNLRDITISHEYSAICGYTEADLETVFAPETKGLDREQIRHWYNGYNWTGEGVYNPFDVLLLFQERQFRPWWFETATPTFLVDLLTKRQVWLPSLNHLETDASLLSAFDTEYISTEALLFQSGYLTIEQEELIGGNYFYRLRYPNIEVFQSLNAVLLDAWTANRSAVVQQRKSLYRLLQKNDFKQMQSLITSFFNSIPNDWYRKNPIAHYEGYYASVFYAYFASLGLDIVPEESSNKGRLDMAVRFNQQVYLFEFKVIELEPKGRALQQIKERGYADKYRGQGLPIHMIGVEFSREQRTVTGFEVETITG
ncbi:MAG: ATP-binding protein [Candidatus Electrothrix scaldis]|nr:MAG: ATP-binding protein [Candidatus Electrothrix sp. GW3-3]